MPDTLFRVEKLRLSFPDLARKPLLGPAPRVEVLKGLSFTIGRGSVTGIVGESGSGKSTLGRAMVRLRRPDSGHITFDRQEITYLSEDAMRPLRRDLQVIFQDPFSSLNPRRTIGDIVGGPARFHGLAPTRSAAEALAAETLRKVGLPPDMLKRYPHELSGGQRQRVGIARAIILEPRFVLADEIVSGLDVSTQARILNLLEEIAAAMDLTMAFISHDLSVVRHLCDRVIVMRHGEIVENAETAQLFDAPQHPYTRQLLGAIPLPETDPDWLSTPSSTTPQGGTS